MANSTVKTKHFTAVYSGEDLSKGCTEPWNVYKKGTAADGTPVCTASCGTPDAYKCTEIRISFAEKLSAEEYIEIFEALIGVFGAYSNTVFYRVARSTVEAEGIPQSALDRLRFAEDPADAAYLLREELIPGWGTIYMCLGLSCGMAIGMSAGQTKGMLIGVCIGVIAGYAFGTAVSNSRKAAREELKAARISGDVPADEE